MPVLEGTFRTRDNVLRVAALLPMEYVLQVAALLPMEYVLRVAALLPIEYVLRVVIAATVQCVVLVLCNVTCRLPWLRSAALFLYLSAQAVVDEQLAGHGGGLA